jgi:Tfp pilus assembly protein PilV
MSNRIRTTHLSPRPRHGLSLAEVVVALAILGGVLISLGMFSARMARSTSAARFRIAAAQLAADRLEFAKGAPRYTAIESLTVATEANVTSADGIRGFTRRSWVQHVGGGLADTIDYKTVTVQVTHSQMSGNVRKTTVIAPF